jgi:hypothetical protein
VFRAFGAHCQVQTFKSGERSLGVDPKWTPKDQLCRRDCVRST